VTSFSTTEAYIGIDPGKSGGIACFYNDDDVVRVSKCPDTPEGMYTIYGILTHGYDKVYAYIEHVWGFPSDSSKTAFVFGLNYGCWKTILEISNCQHDMVNPRVWQKHNSLLVFLICNLLPLLPTVFPCFLDTYAL